jgi:GGDEF domain-containing protein
MIPTPKILQALGWLLVVAFIPFVLAILSVDIHVSDIKEFLFDRFVKLTSWQVILVLVAFVAALIFVNHQTFKRDKQVNQLAEQVYRKDQMISTIERHLHDAKQIRFLDVVTGIPNEAKWKIDIQALAAAASEELPYHIALIDLVSFGALNDAFGYAKVDQILKYLARALDDSMRKNEGLYRRHLDDAALLPDRLYRKYPGGDEFYIVAEGSEADMLGLLVRLQRLITTRIDSYVSKEIAQEPIQLRFSGAVCRLYREESPDSLTDRLIEVLRPTRYPTASKRLNWESGKRSVDFPPDSLPFRLYKQAEDEFVIAKRQASS